MPNQEKIEIVDSLTEKIKKASALYFAKYTGMNVEQATILRQCFTDSSVEFLVSKNTLTKIAVGNAGLDAEKFGEFLNGQIAIAYANDDPTAPARVIKNFSKENECLQVVGLYFDGELYDADKFVEFASLASKEELLGKLVSCLNSPMFKLASTLNSSMSKVVFALKAIQK